MTPHRILVTLALLFALVTRGAAQQRDLRDQFGTKSLQAARHFAKAIRLARAKKHPEALAAIQAALKADPRCQLMHFWHGNTLRTLGKISECIAAYKKALAADIPRGANISAMAAQSLGDVLFKLEKYDEAGVWFTRAVLEDGGNRARQRGLAYRNLCATRTRQGNHLAAGLALLMALKDKTPGVTEKQVETSLDKGEEQEAATLLSFPGKTPAVAKRGQDTKLTAVALGTDIAEPIFDILADPKGRYLIALTRAAPHYYLVRLGAKPAVTKVALKSAPACGCLAEGFLYLAANNPARIDRLEPLAGKVAKTYPLKNFVPTSMAVFPHPVLSPDGLGGTAGVAFFPLGTTIHALDFANGSLSKTDLSGEAVVGHPGQQFVFSYLKSMRTRWRQTTLAKAAIRPGELAMAGIRVNAASNAFRMQVSPDGHWVAVAGGGGWRPAAQQKGGGYGVAVFSAHDLGSLHGYFEVGAYPLGVCFNPVTQQVAVLRAQGAKVYHLSDSKTSVELKGQFNGAAAWSGNGQFLALANTKGLSLWQNTLSAAETKRAATWWKGLVVKVRTQPTVTCQPVKALTRFTPKKPSRQELAAALARLAKEGRTDRPPRWQEYADYVKKAEVPAAFAAALTLLRKGSDLGIAVFRIEKALKAHPDAVPLKFVLAEALRRGGQPKKAEKLYLEVVRGDAGRTELSGYALNGLFLLLRQEQPLAALDCLAASLALDRGNPNTLAAAIALLKKQKYDTEADVLGKLVQALPTLADGAVALPKLAKPVGDGKKHSAEEVYKKAAPSVVLIKLRHSSGSGVCVGKPEFILTNYHVVNGEGPIRVTPFAYQKDKLVRLPAVGAKVVFQSPKDDVAVLQLDKAPRSLVPLEVAAANPAAGSRVYALGSPGLGKEILEQSISQGIISAAKRLIEGRPYLQHTAAVNPGNSGGPLIDEKCRLVGLVTLKAKLDKVSFAIPVGRVREIFKSP
jgi:S1-C subfamily serine protease/Tfp pilus assembly protein PilF